MNNIFRVSLVVIVSLLLLGSP